MLLPWARDLESLEAINQDADIRQLVLRMANLARRIVQQGLSVRAAERAARWSGAKTKPRKRAPVDPALATRARHALERLTGAAVHVRETRIEIAFADEAELEEIVEGLEGGGRI